jgi:YfiR/HmsC-like
MQEPAVAAERLSSLSSTAARRTLLLRMLGMLSVLALGFGCPAVAAERPEHEVKAAFLYNFGKYVRWPKSMPEPDSAFVIALLGTDPFGAALDEMVRGNRIDNRPVAVRRVSKLSELGACEVLFIGASEEARLESILAELPKAPILTVGDMPRFVERGGMIGLVMSNRRVQFEVNAEAAERSGLMLGSQLMRLARAVVDSKTTR